MFPKPGVLTFVLATALAASLQADELDHVLFDFQGSDPAEGWWLNIWGKNPEGEKGAGSIAAVPGRRNAKALHLETRNAGKCNFVAPTIQDGPWRNRPYHAISVWYRGNGEKTKLTCHVQTAGPDGVHHSYSGRLFLGSTEWQHVALKSFWRREGTPPLDLSRLERIMIGASGSHQVTIGKIVLLAGQKNVYLKPVDPQPSTTQQLAGGVKIGVWRVELATLDKGHHVCRLMIENDEPEPLNAAIDVSVFNDQDRLSSNLQVTVASGGEQTVNIPLEFESTSDEPHRLAVAVRDAKGRTIWHGDYRFRLSSPRSRRYGDVVLWPPPQVWQPAGGTWILPETCSVRLDGEGDRFPLEHLTTQLSRRYGVSAREAEESAARFRLEYVSAGPKAESFLLDVDHRGVHLQASSGRGMYYGVRALLDAICQSSIGEAEAQCRHVHCEDWPAVPRRVLFHRIDHYYRGPRSVEAYKDFIYDQVAGGRFNLLILNCRGAVQYESHPELAMRNALTREQLREILDFARRHYVEVAPGANSPGHADWIVGRKPELAEDGDRSTLCTRHPDTLPLVRDVYSELVDLFQPTSYFHLGGDEVRWKTAVVERDKRCPRCEGVEKRDLLRDYWTALIALCRQKGVRPILWEDMLSERWNGGEPYHTARILPQLPNDVIVASWSIRDVVNPPSVYRDLGLTAWKVNTSFAPEKMDDFPFWWRDYEALGVAVFMTWPWCNFVHTSYPKMCSYTTPAIHACAAVNWKPQTAAQGWHEMVASQGPHWMKVMQVAEWGTRKISYNPVSIAAVSNDSTLDPKAGDGTGWMDLGPEGDLRALPRGRLVVGAIPFDRPEQDNDCVLLRAEQSSKPLPIRRRVRGLAFLHTAAASDEQIKQLYTRFFRKNTSSHGMPVAYYRVRYADDEQIDVPVKLGWHLHFWDCYGPARVMPGASAFWTAEQQPGDCPDFPAGKMGLSPSQTCVWAIEWKNPRPDVPVDHITFVSANTEAAVAILGVTVVE